MQGTDASVTNVVFDWKDECGAKGQHVVTVDEQAQLFAAYESTAPDQKEGIEQWTIEQRLADLIN